MYVTNESTGDWVSRIRLAGGAGAGLGSACGDQCSGVRVAVADASLPAGLGGAWCAGVNDKNQYIQTDLRGMRKVTRLATQGRPGTTDYVKSYKISFSKDGTSFTQHRKVRFFGFVFSCRF